MKIRGPFFLACALSVFAPGARAQSVARLRVADLAVIPFTGYVDTWGVCGAVHLASPITLQLCHAGVFGVVSWSQTVAWRFPVGSPAWRARIGSRHELSLGPSLSLRQSEDCVPQVDDCHRTFGVAVGGAFEHVYWLTRHVGVRTTLDAGTAFHASSTPPYRSTWFFDPVVVASLGLAFAR